jgi:hypothetical protein
MPPRRSSEKDSPAKLARRLKRRWRVVLLRAKGKSSARSRRTTWHQPKRLRGVQFELDEIQRDRIMVQERR